MICPEELALSRDIKCSYPFAVTCLNCNVFILFRENDWGGQSVLLKCYAFLFGRAACPDRTLCFLPGGQAARKDCSDKYRKVKQNNILHFPAVGTLRIFGGGQAARKDCFDKYRKVKQHNKKQEEK